MTYLLRFTGFILQYGCCVVLCLLPFTQASYRRPHKRTLMEFAFLVLLASILYPLYLPLTERPPFGNRSTRSDIYMLLFMLIFIARYLYAIREQWMKKMLVVFLTLVYAVTQFLIVNLAPFLKDKTTDVFSLSTVLLFAATTAILFPIWAWMMKKAVREYLAEIEMSNIRREFVLILAVTLLYFALLLFSSTTHISTDRAFYWQHMAPPLLFSTALLFLFYWMLFRESVRRKRSSDAQRALQIQQLQYEKITLEMENARRLRHDMRHYINGLNDLLERKKLDEMKDFLQELNTAAAVRENEIYCKNATVNGLLQYYTGLARGKNIQCKVQACCGELAISTADLTVLFGNAMENAIHSCEHYGAGSWIEVQVDMIRGSLVVQISNACNEVHPSGIYRLCGDFLPAEAFLSPRAGGGYGLKSLSHTAQKYGGEARFCYDEAAKTFTTRIRLNHHPETL